MFPKITLKAKDYYTTHTIGNDEYLFDGDELLFKVKKNIQDFNFYAYLLDNRIHFLGVFEMESIYYIMYIDLLDKSTKPNIYINELLTLEPLEIL